MALSLFHRICLWACIAVSNGAQGSNVSDVVYASERECNAWSPKGYFATVTIMGGALGLREMSIVFESDDVPRIMKWFGRRRMCLEMVVDLQSGNATYRKEFWLTRHDPAKAVGNGASVVTLVENVLRVTERARSVFFKRFPVHSHPDAYFTLQLSGGESVWAFLALSSKSDAVRMEGSAFALIDCTTGGFSGIRCAPGEWARELFDQP